MEDTDEVQITTINSSAKKNMDFHLELYTTTLKKVTLPEKTRNWVNQPIFPRKI